MSDDNGEKGERLDFEICFCSGEDPDYPASELQREQSKGWQSPRFCEFPQVSRLFLFIYLVYPKIKTKKQKTGNWCASAFTTSPVESASTFVSSIENQPTYRVVYRRRYVLFKIKKKKISLSIIHRSPPP